MNKEKIILSSKNEFMNFLEFDQSGEILSLFDEEGINILKNSNLSEERICYILAYSKYKDVLFKNDKFLDMFLKTRLNYYYASLNQLNEETYDTILNKSISLNMDTSQIANLFSYFNINYKLKILDKWPYSTDLLYSVFKIDHDDSVLSKILNNYNIDLLSHDIDLKSFFERAKNSVLKAQERRLKYNEIIPDLSISPKMIAGEMADKLWNTYDIFELRFILNDAMYCTDPSLLNNRIKIKEDSLIKEYYENDFIYPYNEIYENYNKYIELKQTDEYDLCEQYFLKYRELISKTHEKDLHFKIEEINEKNGIEEVLHYLKQLSYNNLSNYIIDYHFEENYHNIMLDIGELLRFYFDGNVVIDPDRVDLYNKILNIDYLDTTEKLELHEKLKQFNMKELFYDDMAYTRKIVADSIKECALSKETIKKYKDEKLSLEYGVDVYKMDGEPFFGIVKTNIHNKDELPTGHSFTLAGDACLTVFGDPKDSTTYLYDVAEMNPEQIVHVYPYDSFTIYKPYEFTTNATTRVNMFLTPEELVKMSSSYNEILILEQGKKSMDLDGKIPELKRIALYCIDEIRNQDIEAAKNNGTGIILINSSKYERDNNFYQNHRKFDSRNYNYFTNYSEKEEFENSRRF